jgi:hypothetical protein
VILDNDERDVGTSGSAGSAEGSGGSETVVGSSNGGTEQLEQDLNAPEVQDWAARVDSRGNELQES